MNNSVLILISLLLILSAVEAGSGDVSFWRNNFTMTCPENGIWSRSASSVHKESKTFEMIYDSKSKGLYHCEYGEKTKYYFYVEGKVCSNCFELDATLFALIIVADVSITLLLISLIYKCTKKNISRRTKAVDPSQPSSDYDHLKTHSQDSYSFLKNRSR
ncbi:T-cell surface glycoprotein CD3 epsilon chain-like [Stigmatopora nigra]